MARSRTAAALDVIVPLPPANAVAFVDAQHGWVGGQGGLLGTSDGRTFRVEVRSPIVGISALNRTHAWALTGTGFVLRTADGHHWSTLGAPHLFRIQFVDARIGFGMTRDGVLVRSDDSGRTWQQARAPGLVQAECFSTRTDGWLARDGTVWTTHDGGAGWAPVRLRRGQQEIPNVECGGRDAWILFREGAAAGTEGYHVFRSLDGAAWRPVYASPFQRALPSISNYSGPFDVLGNGRAVFTGSCAPCADSGGTATLVSGAARATWSGSAPTAISFVDARHGWIVSAGRLRETSDGGRHWQVRVRAP
ncbi:MAG: hypothetical protein ACJ74M_03640 [Gaiellaceae bacterium]